MAVNMNVDMDVDVLRLPKERGSGVSEMKLRKCLNARWNRPRTRSIGVNAQGDTYVSTSPGGANNKPNTFAPNPHQMCSLFYWHYLVS